MTIEAHTFPVTLTTHWQSPTHFTLNDRLQDWLLDPASLTLRLQSHCADFRVEVLGQSIEPCSEAESSADIPAGSDVLVREVLLFCDDVPHVFARSLLPLASLTGEEKKLAELGNQSLGQILFNSRDLERKGIQVSSFDEHSCVGKLSLKLSPGLSNTHTLATPLWGRRSVFLLNHKPLMVAEVFLPSAKLYQS